jgi:hypothetical protein
VWAGRVIRGFMGVIGVWEGVLVNGVGWVGMWGGEVGACCGCVVGFRPRRHNVFFLAFLLNYQVFTFHKTHEICKTGNFFCARKKRCIILFHFREGKKLRNYTRLSTLDLEIRVYTVCRKGM